MSRVVQVVTVVTLVLSLAVLVLSTRIIRSSDLVPSTTRHPQKNTPPTPSPSLSSPL